MEHIYRQFALDGLPISCARYGSGHINETYLLVTSRPHLYILQKINSYVFHNAAGLMDNIIAVTGALRRQDSDPRHVLTLVPTLDGRPYLTAGEGETWRLYEFVTDSLCLDKPESVDDLKQSGVAFGMFQNQLADFPARTLTETIPHFHDTPARYEQLKQAMRENRAGRLNEVRAELDFYLAREQEAAALMDLCRAGKLPLRVTHNDTKLNNVMLDRFTRAPLCVIDLDTVMPGLAANDFGDSIRFGASTAAEDEKDDSVLVMATNAQFPPYEYIDDDGNYAGIDVDIMTEVAKKLGRTLKVEDMEFDSIIPAVTSGKADVGAAGMTVDPEREKSVDFSVSYATGRQVIIVKNDSDITGPDDLEGKTVGVQSGTTGDIYVSDDGKAKVEKYKSGFEAVQSLLQGKVDAVVIDNEPAKVFVSENEGIKILDTDYVLEEYALCVAKGNTELLDQINTAIEEMIADGTIDTILAKYINAEN